MSEITQQLKSLKNLKPRKDWVDAEREILLSQIAARNTVAKRSFLLDSWYFAKSVLPNGVAGFVARPVGVLTLVAVFMFSSGALSVNASRGSLPGDLLYPVKLTKEKVQVGLTVSKEKKAEKYVGFAEERSKEISAIVKKETNAEVKKQKVQIAAAQMTEQLNKVEEHLEQVKQENKQNVVAVVKKVDEKTEAINANLAATKEETKNDVALELQATLTEAAQKVDEVAVKAIEVIVDKREKGEIDISETELLDNINKKIQKAEEQVKVVAEQVQVISDDKTAADAAEAVKIDLQSGEAASESLTVEAQTTATEAQTAADNLSSVAEKPAQATQALTEAKDLLNHGDLASAVEKLKQTTTIVKEVTASVATITAAVPVATALETEPATEPLPVATEAATVSVDAQTSEGQNQ